MTRNCMGISPSTLRSMQQMAALDSSALALVLIGEAGVYMLRPDIAVPAVEHAVCRRSFSMGGGALRRQVTVFAEALHQAGTLRS